MKKLIQRFLLLFVSFFSFLISVAQVQSIQKIVASDRDIGDDFGYSVSISGNHAIVGAAKKDNEGAVYFYIKNGKTWNQLQKSVLPNPENNEFFGNSVSISGNYAIVGAPFQDTDSNGNYIYGRCGAAYIYKYNGNNWSQIQKIVASDIDTADLFGYSVSISGDYAIIGAHGDGEDENGSNYILGAGSVYIFKNNSGYWKQVQKIVASDRSIGRLFGYSVDISGDYAIVGSYADSTDENGEIPLVEAGSAYILKNESGNWTEVKKIAASDRTGNDCFGYSVSVDGDYAIVGAYNDDEDSMSFNPRYRAGSAYIFKKDADQWNQVQKIVASDREKGDLFGMSVSISDKFAVVGAMDKNTDSNGVLMIWSGAAYIYKNVSGKWFEFEKIEAPDKKDVARFGNAVSIDDRNIIVGSREDYVDSNGVIKNKLSGSAYIFQLKSPSTNQIETFKSNVNIYPNPTHDFINLHIKDLTQSPTTITIFNSSGKLVYIKEIKRAKAYSEQIDLSNQPKGLYFVKIQSGEIVEMRRVVVY